MPDNKVIPLREWVPECFTEDGALVLKPVQSEEGEPLTRAEAFKFWVPVLCFCAVAGLVVGLIVGSLKS